METYSMSSAKFPTLGLLLLLTINETASSGENKTWKSPDGRYQVAHHAVDNLFITAAKPSPDPYAYILWKNGAVLWTGLSFTDESAHATQVLWSPKSKAVLILDKPERSQCEGVVCSLETPIKVHKFNVQTLIDRTFKQASDTDDRILQKAWFEGWHWISNSVVCGEIHCAKQYTYTIFVEFNLKAFGGGLKIIGQKIDKPNS